MAHADGDQSPHRSTVASSPLSLPSLASPNAGLAWGHGDERNVTAAHRSMDAQEPCYSEQLSERMIENTQVFAMHSPKGAPGSTGTGSPFPGCGESSGGTTTSNPPLYADVHAVPVVPNGNETLLAGQSHVTWAPLQLRDHTEWEHLDGEPLTQSQIEQSSSSWASTHQFQVQSDHPPTGRHAPSTTRTVGIGAS